ncbi:hypothetical protein AYI68_g5348 [Smittium mucronatum]|uniref:Uncharacterized protein n=1 Tax=Smittium mucronatum TaxID=133383 RepID=A0A1R0GUJ5_9FUNG|nr:hypothetical protein AYI68_g5348 [Smittium mucronatum]
MYVDNVPLERQHSTSKLTSTQAAFWESKVQLFHDRYNNSNRLRNGQVNVQRSNLVRARSTNWGVSDDDSSDRNSISSISVKINYHKFTDSLKLHKSKSVKKIWSKIFPMNKKKLDEGNITDQEPIPDHSFKAKHESTPKSTTNTSRLSRTKSSGSIDVDYRILDLVPEETVFASQKQLRDLILQDTGKPNLEPPDNRTSCSGQSSITAIDTHSRSELLDLQLLFRVNSISVKKLGSPNCNLRKLLFIKNVGSQSSEMLSLLKKNNPEIYHEALSSFSEKYRVISPPPLPKIEGFEKLALQLPILDTELLTKMDFKSIGLDFSKDKKSKTPKTASIEKTSVKKDIHETISVQKEKKNDFPVLGSEKQMDGCSVLNGEKQEDDFFVHKDDKKTDSLVSSQDRRKKGCLTLNREKKIESLSNPSQEKHKDCRLVFLGEKKKGPHSPQFNEKMLVNFIDNPLEVGLSSPSSGNDERGTYQNNFDFASLDLFLEEKFFSAEMVTRRSGRNLRASRSPPTRLPPTSRNSPARQMRVSYKLVR